MYNDTATTELYPDLHTLSRHDSLPISGHNSAAAGKSDRPRRESSEPCSCDQGSCDGSRHADPNPHSRWRSGGAVSVWKALRRCRSATRCHQPQSGQAPVDCARSEEHTSELQSLMRTSYAVFCLKKKNKKQKQK